MIPNTPPRGLTRPRRRGLQVAGAGLLAATAAIHLDLYVTGYRTIPTIGWLFLLQIVVAFVLAAAVLVSGSRIVAAAGAGFALATLGGYLLTMWVGLFGFTEVRTAAGISAGIVEVTCFAALGVLALAPAAHPQPPGSAAAGHGPFARLRAGVPGAGWPVAAASVAALVVLGVSAALAGGPAPTTGGSLKTATIRGVTVLTNARGSTLYWFAPRHGYHVELHRVVRRLLATGDRHPGRRAQRHWQARHDHPPRRHNPGHLRRAPPLHLRRRRQTRGG